MGTTITMRVGEECKDFLYDLAKKYDNPVGKVINDLYLGIESGSLSYDGNTITGQNSISENFSENKKEGIDLTRLYKAAEKRRVTPESFYNMLLKNYGV